jgi:hypothetical protein
MPSASRIRVIGKRSVERHIGQRCVAVLPGHEDERRGECGHVAEKSGAD